MDGSKEYLKQRGFDDTIIKEWKLEPNTNEVLINYLDPNIAKHILRKYKSELILPNDFTPEGLFNLLSDKPPGLIALLSL
jgi:hypothetical protein